MMNSSARRTFKEHLLAFPDIGDDADFSRSPDRSSLLDPQSFRPTTKMKADETKPISSEKDS